MSILSEMLTMRASVQRAVSPTAHISPGEMLQFDGYTYSGSPSADIPPSVVSVDSDLPCFVYGRIEQSVVSDDTTLTIGDYTMIVELDADIAEHDEVVSVRDIMGRDFLSDKRMRVLKDIPRTSWTGGGLRHRELMLEVVD